jgi:hypothetical protein
MVERNGVGEDAEGSRDVLETSKNEEREIDVETHFGKRVS